MVVHLHSFLEHSTFWLHWMARKRILPVDSFPSSESNAVCLNFWPNKVKIIFIWWSLPPEHNMPKPPWVSPLSTVTESGAVGGLITLLSDMLGDPGTQAHEQTLALWGSQDKTLCPRTQRARGTAPIWEHYGLPIRRGAMESSSLTK